jgi:hypothetical protein
MFALAAILHLQLIARSSVISDRLGLRLPFFLDYVQQNVSVLASLSFSWNSNTMCLRWSPSCGSLSHSTTHRKQPHVSGIKNLGNMAVSGGFALAAIVQSQFGSRSQENLKCVVTLHERQAKWLTRNT